MKNTFTIITLPDYLFSGELLIAVFDIPNVHYTTYPDDSKSKKVKNLKIL